MYGRSPDDCLFPGPGGKPLRNDYLSWRFDKAAEKAGLAGITIKTLRHTAGSLALQAGASVGTVQKLFGAPQRHHHDEHLQPHAAG
jgi:integrase